MKDAVDVLTEQLQAAQARIAELEMERAVAVKLLEEHRANPELGAPPQLVMKLTESQSVDIALELGAQSERDAVVRFIRTFAANWESAGEARHRLGVLVDEINSGAHHREDRRSTSSEDGR